MSKQAALAFSIACMVTGCNASSDFIVVEPVRYVAPPSKPTPNARYGWVPTTPENAERFSVKVGDITYQRIIEPYKVNGEISFEAAVLAFASFAEQEVVERNYCSKARVPDDSRQLFGSSTPPSMHIAVQCLSDENGT